MAKRRSTIPVAHAGGVPIEFTDEQWQAVECAYGRQLNAEVRQQITTVTTRYLKDHGFERTAAPKEIVRENIEHIRRAADDLERAMLGASFDGLPIEQRQNAHSYVNSLIQRYLVPSPPWNSRRYVRPDDLMSHIADVVYEQLDSFDAQCNRQRLAREKLHQFRSALKPLVVACDYALNDLSAAEGYRDSQAWGWWIQGLTQIAREHGLPAGTRIVEMSGEISPFVALVRTLQLARAVQEHVPARHMSSDEALAKAIQRAQAQGQTEPLSGPRADVQPPAAAAPQEAPPAQIANPAVPEPTAEPPRRGSAESDPPRDK
jgi:hypothetical protein